MDSGLKTAAILGISVVAAVAALSAVLGTLDSESPRAGLDGTEAAPVDRSSMKAAPELAGIAGYINTTPAALAAGIDGSVVLYDIWTYSCINCVRTLPYITSWSEKYSDDGLLVIGVHSPEFEFEKDAGNVQRAVERHGITYPVVLDNDMETWKAFENRYWPRKYIADHEGYIRYDHIGEGDYENTETVIQELLRERAAALGMQEPARAELVDLEAHSHESRTPELYFGYAFAYGRNQLGSAEGFAPGMDVEYAAPAELEANHFYLEGTWRNHEGSMELISEEGAIFLPYYAKQVNIVAGNPGGSEVDVLLDGEPVGAPHAGADVEGGALIAGEHDLYNVISAESAAPHVLELRASGAGFEMYTFTFG